MPISGFGSNEGVRTALRVIFVVPALLVAGCVPQAQVAQAAPAPMAAAAPVQRAPAYRPAPAPTPVNVTAQRILDTRIQALGRNFSGEVGIAVQDIQSRWTGSYNGERLFPQQSVSKFWVAVAALDRADRGDLDMSQSVTLRRDDLTLFHQPIRELVGGNGYTLTLDNLMFRAMTQSDNTCNDVLLRRAGGPEAVRTMLQRKGIEGVRFGPGERLLQSGIAGVQWQPSYSIGNAFYAARNAVPMSTRRTLFENYIADPIDGASAVGIVDGLAMLRRGELLSPASTERLLSVMSQTRTGPQRLTGGLAPGWRISHKTGTGQVLNGTQAGYNDIGILSSPDGRHYAVAVMIGRTSTPLGTRMQLMQETTRAVIAYHQNLQGYRSIASQ